MKKLILFLIAFIIIVILLDVVNKIILPTDILKSLPLFSIDKWQKSQNSLLADPIFQFEPWRIYVKEMILKGQFPFWNNFNAGGVPFFANPITAVFSLPTLLYVLFPAVISLPLALILKIFLFAYFTYLYLKGHKISPFYSMLGSINVTSGFFFLWLLWPQTNVYLFFPLILCLIDKFNKRSYINIFAGLTFVYFLAYLGGHPETFFMIGLISLIYGLLIKKEKIKSLWMIVLSILTGLLLASFQLFPFMEYLLNSYMLSHRASGVSNSTLPLLGVIYNFFPLILGAPHLQIYKPLSTLTNFQELAGGYVGIIPIAFSVVAIKNYFKNIFVKTWFYILLISLVFTYKLPFVTTLINLTPLKVNANERMIAFVGFSIVMLFVFALAEIAKKTIKLSKRIKVGLFFIPFIFLILDVLARIYLDRYLEIKYQSFAVFLMNYLFLVAASTSIFLYILSLRGKIGSKYYKAGLGVALFVQSVLFFMSYPVVFTKNAYPANEVTNILNMGNSRVLQVGNPNLPPDINLAYSIPSAENYDALDVSSYKKEFDREFSVKNHWGNVDQVTASSLQKFGVTDIISDYNINLEKESVNGNEDVMYKLESPVNSMLFQGNDKELSQIRFITANYNKNNVCMVRAELISVNTQEKFKPSYFLCAAARDKMYFSLNYPKTLIKRGYFYEILFTPIFATTDNYIALVGNNKGVYLDLLFDKGSNFYKQRFFKQSVYLFHVPEVNLIEGLSSIKNLNQTSTQTKFVGQNGTDTKVIVKLTKYPGWEVLIDGNKINLDNYMFFKFNFPKGEHIVDIQYKPTSFIVGLIFSLATFFALLIIVLRSNRNRFNLLMNKWGYLSKKIDRKVEWYEHITFVVLGIIISIILLIIIIRNLDLSFKVPATTAINWFTVHKYPRQQDYFFFILDFSFIFIGTVISWIILVWKKIKK